MARQTQIASRQSVQQQSYPDIVEGGAFTDSPGWKVTTKNDDLELGRDVTPLGTAYP